MACICYFLNCLSTSLYVVSASPTSDSLDHLQASGQEIPAPRRHFHFLHFCYLLDDHHRCLLLCWYRLLQLCHGVGQSDKWGIPLEGIWQLCYWVLISSVLAYLLMVWIVTECTECIRLGPTSLWTPLSSVPTPPSSPSPPSPLVRSSLEKYVWG